MSPIILVTGASSGIGRATAARLADAGHVVYAAARREPELKELATEHPAVRPIVMDVTDPDRIADARDRIEHETDGHGLDVLINAAGVLEHAPVELTSDELVRRQLDVNVLGLLSVTRAFVPRMRERGSGRIVNVSSVLGKFVLPGSGTYSATKFAVEAISDALRMELAPFGVRVVLVEPGVASSSLYDAAGAHLSGDDATRAAYHFTWTAGFGFPAGLLKKAMPAEIVAVKIAQAALTSNPRARYRLGARNRFNTRLLTMLPAAVTDRIKRRIAGVSSKGAAGTNEA
jgi:NAD(P)-dependent dehydrogenase (short-subunit alcohol dehydrogenase family)